MPQNPYKIFISYRREDTPYATFWIYERLTGHFGKEEVFLDQDTIPIGADFRQYLSEAVSQCAVLLAVIGDSWLHACEPGGEMRRLETPGDFVAIEIRAALERGIPVIPVLVERALMPRAAELPEDLRDLAFRQASEVRHGADFNQHVERLIQAIDRLCEIAPGATSRPQRRRSAGSKPFPKAPSPQRRSGIQAKSKKTGDLLAVPSGKLDSGDSTKTNSIPEAVGNFFEIMKARQNKNLPPLIDPTEPLPHRPVELRSLDISVREQLVAEFTKVRLLLLSSFEPAAAVAAAYSVIFDESLAQHERRALVLGRRALRDRSDLTITLLSDCLVTKKQVLLVEIDRPCPFLDSLLDMTHTSIGFISNFLRDRDSLVVCTASSEALNLDFDQQLSAKFPLCHRPVPALPYILRGYFSSERAKELEMIVGAQLERGLWQSRTELYENVSYYLETDGPVRLEQEVRRLDEFPFKALPVRATSLFRDEAGVHAAALYTAAYFPDLTPQDFEAVVLLLLGDRTTKVDKDEQVLTEKGKTLTLRTTFDRALKDMWLESPDRILRECALRTVFLRSGEQFTHVMDFNFPYLRRELRELLEARYPMFLMRMFDRLLVGGLLFALQASPSIIKNLLHLIVERVKSDPAFRGRNYLFNWIASLRLNFEVPIDIADPIGQFFQMIAELHGSEKRHFLARYSQLLRELYKYGETREAVDDLLSTLLASHQEPVLMILLDLVEYLRFISGFDVLRLMRRIMDQGRKYMRQVTYRRILSLALDSGARVLDILEPIHDWLPAETRPRDMYSPSNLYAMRILLEYSLQSVLAFDERYLGEWPSRYALFAALPNDPGALEAWAHLLCGWLLHKEIPSILVSKDAEKNSGEEADDLLELDVFFTDHAEAHACLVADQMEQWLLILEGTGTVAPEARLLSDAFISALSELASPSTRVRLLRRWDQRQQECTREAHLLGGSPPKMGSGPLEKQKKVSELKHRFVAGTPEDSGRR